MGIDETGVEARGRRPDGARGFTLLEVLVAVAILSLSLTSLLGSQMQAMRATDRARQLSAIAFLAEAQLIEIEWELKRDGWGVDDQTFDGDFSEQGWPDVHYACVVDLIEMPDYNQLVEAKDASETDGDDDYIQDAGDQAFGALGMVWPVVKEAIEQSIRKSSCTVRWNIAQRKGKGNKKLDDPVCDEDELDCLTIMTFWTDPAKLDQLPSLGGEVTDEDDPSTDDGGGGGGGGSGRGGGQGTGKPGGEGSGSSSRIPTVGGGRGGIK
ncbi:MAG: prepilin-type N-terminal cleavage/methylation domain-containing protein [Myxococcales bacterium]|nr:prepilin-type N-terminal cleavage/methylation domain-containing protein [Myxococcales bacterium]